MSLWHDSACPHYLPYVPVSQNHFSTINHPRSANFGISAHREGELMATELPSFGDRYKEARSPMLALAKRSSC